ncbi:hypothetical protein M7I_5666 [Glarea lozoyensis 74030]|uniref:BTB domain-containing protein n=1 Tax=Glarea lozoyensis (strain ATCC 74030 / MF5533) TaxID=1104152 RepID=H0ESH8_GLAL7|nr:hypothetical protein M7I_5666 [Glarea lozoyensis 74030]
MMLASEHFEKLLSSETREGRTLKSTGHVTIPMTVDPDTLIILLQIIHGKTREVPRQVSLDLLRKLAIMVNDFGMLASVEFFADTWIDHSKREGLPASYTEDVLSWLFVSFVFGRPEEFKDMANISQRECDEKFVDNAQEIHLPGGIVDAIKQGRQTAINTVISVIHKLITKYMDGTTHCEVGMDDNMRFACDAMLLGSLMKGSHKIGIWPKPEAPFNGQKYNELAKAIRGIKMLDVCGKSAGRKWSSYGGFEGNAHELENFIDNELKAVEENLGSLDLESFSSENATTRDIKKYTLIATTRGVGKQTGIATTRGFKEYAYIVSTRDSQKHSHVTTARGSETHLCIAATRKPKTRTSILAAGDPKKLARIVTTRVSDTCTCIPTTRKSKTGTGIVTTRSSKKYPQKVSEVYMHPRNKKFQEARTHHHNQSLQGIHMYHRK